MFVVVVDGVSGCGKSTLARQLHTRGEIAISTDADKSLCRWIDADGDRVGRPNAPSLEWLDGHRWVWDPVRLDDVLAAARAAGTSRLWLCGGADNTAMLIERFDLSIMLDIDEQTMLARIADPSRGNDYGTVGDTAAHLRHRFPVVRETIAAWVDVVHPATGDRGEVATQVIAIADARMSGAHSVG